MKLTLFITSGSVVARTDSDAPSQDIRVDVGSGSWSQAIRDALESARRSATRRHSASAHVQLGMTHSRIALMPISSGAVTEEQVQAFCRSELHIDPQEQVIRWKEMAGGQTLLVACVARHIAEELVQAFAEAKLTLASCLPAAVHFVRKTGKSRRTLVWTEATGAGRRTDVVQLLRIEGGDITGTWRGWIPSDAPSYESDVGAVLERFQIQYSATSGEQVDSVEWPMGMTA